MPGPDLKCDNEVALTWLSTTLRRHIHHVKTGYTNTMITTNRRQVHKIAQQCCSQLIINFSSANIQLIILLKKTADTWSPLGFRGLWGSCPLCQKGNLSLLYKIKWKSFGFYTFCQTKQAIWIQTNYMWTMKIFICSPSVHYQLSGGVWGLDGHLNQHILLYMLQINSWPFLLDFCSPL